MRRAGRDPAGRRALVVGAGGVGSAIAASLAAAGVAALSLHDVNAAAAEALAARLRRHYPALALATGGNDPAGHDIVVNATPLGMNEADPLPLDPARLAPSSFVGEVVLRPDPTPLLRAALARACQVQPGEDMLLEQIPAYLAWFGLGTATPEQLRQVALPQ
jgi:shikimate dehydrogenase